MNFDLHCHSHFSDGELSPADLLALASKRKIDVLALTDHDTVSGIVDAQEAATHSEVQFISGVEFSVSWQTRLLHVVGLNVDPDNDQLAAGIHANGQRREQRARLMIEDFNKHSIDIQSALFDQLNSASVATRPHFAKALVALGIVNDERQAFKRYLVRGKPGYVPMSWPDLETIACWIKAAGGVAVLAHPLRYKLTRTKLRRLLMECQQAGIEGVEVSTANTDLQQLKMLANLCEELAMLASIGSDFHSFSQPWSMLGNAPKLPKALTPVWSAF